MAKVLISVPDEMRPYVEPSDEKGELVRNALLLLPHIKSGEISHGKAAGMLGVTKYDLIALYGKLGIAYIDMSPHELEEELVVAESIAVKQL